MENKTELNIELSEDFNKKLYNSIKRQMLIKYLLLLNTEFFYKAIVRFFSLLIDKDN